MTSIEIRVLAPAGIEDYHAHLLRLDASHRRACFANEADDRGIDGHCLKLLGRQAIMIGGYVDGVLRAGLEILPDRTARHAEAIFTAEPAYHAPGMTRMLIARLFDEARSYRLTDLTLHGLDDLESLQRAAAQQDVAVTPGSPIRVQFLAIQQSAAVSRGSGAPVLSVAHA